MILIFVAAQTPASPESRGRLRTMPLIELHTLGSGLDLTPHRYPAATPAPGWLKDMPADHEHGGTRKRCPPFLAAMTSGYIIPAPADATIVLSDTGEISARGTLNYLSTHFPAQVKGAPFGNARIVKFENPWIIVTPPDYVCLITAPINRFEIPFTALTGIVETGSYYREIHRPMACEMKPGQTYKLQRGAPMIQVIPMKREAWASRVGPVDERRRAEQQAMIEANPHMYKDEFWRKA